MYVYAHFTKWYFPVNTPLLIPFSFSPDAPLTPSSHYPLSFSESNPFSAIEYNKRGKKNNKKNHVMTAPATSEA